MRKAKYIERSPHSSALNPLLGSGNIVARRNIPSQASNIMMNRGYSCQRSWRIGTTRCLFLVGPTALLLFCFMPRSAILAVAADGDRLLTSKGKALEATTSTTFILDDEDLELPRLAEDDTSKEKDTVPVEKFHRSLRQKRKKRKMMRKKKGKARKPAGIRLSQLVQPKRITRVETGRPASRIVGSISAAKGSPWCKGRPTFWLVGHDKPDYPYCQNAAGRWYPRKAVRFDLYKLKPGEGDHDDSYDERIDEFHEGDGDDLLGGGERHLSIVHEEYIYGQSSNITVGEESESFDVPAFLSDRDDANSTQADLNNTSSKATKVKEDSDEIDRHDCLALDVNEDGRDDIICMVGAKNWGSGLAFNELYLTRKDGTLLKVRDHGLHEFPTTRSLLTTKLKNALTGEWLVYVATVGGPRIDGRPNNHRMYQVMKNHRRPFFKHTPGPWELSQADAACTVSGDFNGDGYDDLIVCERRGYARMYVQTEKGKFVEVFIKKSHKRWRNARVDFVTGNDRPDLVVVEGYFDDTPLLRIYRGIPKAPYFDFGKPYLTLKLPHAAADLEIVDVDKNGIADIYVLQSNERDGYCATRGGDQKTPKGGLAQWWGGGKPEATWVPPENSVKDLLLLGKIKKGKVKFSKVLIKHKGKGCGGLLRTFGNKQSLIVARSRILHYGYNYLYEWAPRKIAASLSTSTPTNTDAPSLTSAPDDEHIGSWSEPPEVANSTMNNSINFLRR